MASALTSTVLVGRLDDLRVGHPYRVEAGPVAVVLVRIGEDVYALEDRCSHQNVRLSEGDVWADDLEIECHRHGSTFSLVTGDAQNLPATAPVAVFGVEIEDGSVYLRLEPVS